jgi:hypothetical protein
MLLLYILSLINIINRRERRTHAVALLLLLRLFRTRFEGRYKPASPSFALRFVASKRPTAPQPSV